VKKKKIYELRYEKKGKCFCKIAAGFGVKLLCSDAFPDKELSNSIPNLKYVALDDLIS
jgi:hypothetical protein